MSGVTVPCQFCSRPTTMVGTKACDRCWHMGNALQGPPDLVLKILSAVAPELLPDELARLRGEVSETQRLLRAENDIRRKWEASSDDLRAKLEAAERDAESAKLAYGWLWHSFANDPRVHSARRALANVLDRGMRLAGIEMAKAAGATVDESHVINLDAATKAMPTTSTKGSEKHERPDDPGRSNPSAN